MGFSVLDSSPIQLLVAGKTSGVKLIDVDGAPLAEPGPYNASELSSGVLAQIGDASLSLYPGISASTGKITLYAHGTGLLAPIEIALTPGIEPAVEGMCATRAYNSDALIRIGYWTQLDPSTLVLGEISSTDGALSYKETAKVTHDKYLTSCDLDGDLIATGGGFGMEFMTGVDEPIALDIPIVPTSMAVSHTAFGDLAAMTDAGGRVYVALSDGKVGQLSFEAGISSPAPQEVGSVALSTLGSVGGLPNGFLAVESRANGKTQIIYVDMKELVEMLG